MISLTDEEKSEIRARRLRRRPARVFWVVSLVATLLGCFIGFVGIVGASGAPQEAAAAGIALLVVIAPYAFARAIDEVLRD